MHHGNAFSIHTFFPYGDPSGLRVVKKDNWSGRAIAFRRERMDEATKWEDLKSTGVYILRGEEDVGVRIYIGEADVIMKRLKKHVAKRDFWTAAVAFIRKGDNLDKAEVRYLEARLIQIAESVGRCMLDNDQRPDSQRLLEDDREAAAEGYLEELLECLPALGISEFEPGEKMPPKMETEDSEGTIDSNPSDSGPKDTPCDQRERTLRVVRRGVEARGFYLSDCSNFKVLNGATAVKEVTPSMRRPEFRGSRTLRDRLRAEGRLVENGAPPDMYVLKGDYIFSSPSQAEMVLAGRAGSGLFSWPLSSADTANGDNSEDDSDDEDDAPGTPPPPSGTDLADDPATSGSG